MHLWASLRVPLYGFHPPKKVPVAKLQLLSDTRGMDKTKGDFEVHVFVCTNQRDGGKECCADQGAEGLLKELKDWSKKNPEWRKRIRINSSGCIDRCSEGIAMAIYPQNQWLVNVKPKNIDEVKKRIEKLMAKVDDADDGADVET